MQTVLGKCVECNEYALNIDTKTICPRCGTKLKNPHPPHFSPDDKYLDYVRRMKELADEH